MKFKQLVLSVATVAGVGLGSISPALAQVTVRMMHVDQNPDVQAFYADVAKRFEATKPGV